MRIALLLLGSGLVISCGKDKDTTDDADADADADADTDTDPVFSHTNVQGNNFRMALSLGDWITPTDAPATTNPILVGISGVTANAIDFFFAFPEGKSNTQNICLQTQSLPSASLSGNGSFSVGPTDWLQLVGGGSVTAYDFEFSGQFWVDGTGADDVYYANITDFRESAPLIGQSATDVCDLLATGTRPCEACPSDNAVFCWTTEVGDVPLQDFGLDPLVERTASQIAADTVNCP